VVVLVLETTTKRSKFCVVDSKVKRGGGEMAVRDDRSDVKQTTAGFWASDGPRPSFVKSKFLSFG